MAIVKFIIAFYVANLIHIGFLAGMSFFVRVGIKKIQIGMGPLVWRRRIHGVQIAHAVLPIGGFVKQTRSFYDSISIWKKSIFILSGCAATYLVAILAHGFALGNAMVSTGFHQIIFGAWHPSTDGRGWVLDAAHFVSTSSFFGVLGAICAKSCALNLLPLPLLNGGMLLIEFCKLIKPISQEHLNTIGIWSLFAYLLLVIGWMMAVGYVFTIL